jgi:glycosyltransferase involved in cell wall biosynthesis
VTAAGARLVGLRVHHVGPERGGVAQYAAAVDDAYRLLGVTVIRSWSDPADLVHLELGSGDADTWAAVRSAAAGALPYLLTVHDPGEPVRHPRLLPAAFLRGSIPAALTQRAVDLTAGRAEVTRLLRDAEGRVATVGPPRKAATWWLPHPRMTPANAPTWEPAPDSSVPFGHVGYWGPEKGLGTLAAAWKQAQLPAGPRLVVAGASGSPDRYEGRMRRKLSVLPAVDLPGALPDGELDGFLVGLRAVVLPYRRGWPAGASGVAQRAAELGVPIIASGIPALRAQLGDDGAVWVPADQPAALAAALRSACQEQEHLVAAAAAARSRVAADSARLPELLADAVEGVLSLGRRESPASRP